MNRLTIVCHNDFIGIV